MLVVLVPLGGQVCLSQPVVFHLWQVLILENDASAPLLPIDKQLSLVDVALAIVNVDYYNA